MGPTVLIRTRSALALAVALGLLLTARAASAGGDWNDAGVKWQSYDEGLAAAKKENKPICLIFYTDWCPHCKNYSGVFHDQRVVDKTKQFVMIHLNGDQNKELSQKYAPDGAYIPRTFFLSPKGDLDPALGARDDKFKYFYDEQNPTSILAGMDAALKKLH